MGSINETIKMFITYKFWTLLYLVMGVYLGFVFLALIHAIVKRKLSYEKSLAIVRLPTVIFVMVVTILMGWPLNLALAVFLAILGGFFVWHVGPIYMQIGKTVEEASRKRIMEKGKKPDEK